MCARTHQASHCLPLCRLQDSLEFIGQESSATLRPEHNSGAHSLLGNIGRPPPLHFSSLLPFSTSHGAPCPSTSTPLYLHPFRPPYLLHPSVLLPQCYLLSLWLPCTNLKTCKGDWCDWCREATPVCITCCRCCCPVHFLCCPHRKQAVD